jgi:hypothetical protein
MLWAPEPGCFPAPEGLEVRQAYFYRSGVCDIPGLAFGISIESTYYGQMSHFKTQQIVESSRVTAAPTRERILFRK